MNACVVAREKDHIKTIVDPVAGRALSEARSSFRCRFINMIPQKMLEQAKTNRSGRVRYEDGRGERFLPATG
jgi:hypothetical protein